VPRIHGLAEKRDLANPPGNQVTDLADDLVGRPVALGAACIGNDTKGATLVTALHHGDVCRDLPPIGVWRSPQELRVIHVEHGARDRRRPVLDPADQGRELGDVVRAEHDVDEGRLLEQAFALLLSHAPRNRQHGTPALLLERSESPEKAHQLVLRLLPDAAGIDDQKVGQGGLGRLPIAALPEHLLDPAGIVDVHLAAEGLDEVLLHRSGGGSFSRLGGRPPNGRNYADRWRS